MTDFLAPSRPIHSPLESAPDVCPWDKTDLEAEWSYCPDCGSSTDSMDRDKSEWLCSCSETRMKLTADRRGSRNEKHECLECGAIWFALDWATDADREPDDWNKEKATAAWAAHLKRLYDFDMPMPEAVTA